MVPFIETITSQMDLVAACKKGYDDFTLGKISKNDFFIYFGFTHAEAIIKFYGERAKDQEKLFVGVGFESGSSAYFSAGINAWKNLKTGKYVFPPFHTIISLPTEEKKCPLQQIFYGAPGTGKSHKIDGETKDDNSIRTTFHPDTDYATFVGAYKPMMEETEVCVVPVVLNNGASFDQNNGTYKEKRIVYKYEPQAFLKAYVEAWKKWLGDDEDKKYYLVIEEINRGNCAQIFGDLFQLLDREDDGFSGYAISPESSITKYLAEEAQSADGTKFSDLVFSDVIKKRVDGATKIIATADDLKAGKRLVLPPNLHIWATMNTSDQSLFPIDSAFKRRWDWKYIKIKDEGKNWSIEGGHDWWKFLKKINKVVLGMTSSADKQLGYFFCKANDTNNEISKETFVNKVCFYLWNDVFKSFYSDEYADLFKIKKDGNDGELTFPDFFDDNGNVDSEIAEQFIGNVMKFGESQDKPTENQEAQA